MPRGQAISYTDGQLQFLKNHSKLPRKEMTKLFNTEFGTDISQKNLAALCKRKGWFTGRDGRYEKGKKPWNKGVTGYMGANKTSFKKGQRPPNWRPVGSERITVDGYVEVKVSNTGKRWRLKHQVVYEQAHGKPPKGHAVIFIDSNKQNCDIDNLRLVSRAELAVLNKNFSRENLTKEGNNAVITMAKIKTKVGQVRQAKSKK